MAGNDAIEIDTELFFARFPYFSTVGATEEQIMTAYNSVFALIDVHGMNLPTDPAHSDRAVYLATAHQLYLAFNPDKANGRLQSANEGSVSASFTQNTAKGWFDYYFSLTVYGLELLAIFSQIQPPQPKRPVGTYPYYNTVGGFYGKRRF